ncbi:MAG: hypothetical protein QM808_11580 [Steroidobacteraceae bacterium]
MPPQLQNEHGVLSAVRQLLDASMESDDVADSMESLIGETSSLSLINMDAWERRIRDEVFRVEQSKSRFRWKFWKRPVRFACWLDLCSWDGFKRERVLRALSQGAPNGFFYVLLLRRLNDWVPEVRAAARDKLLQVAVISNPEHIVDALWSILTNWNMWGHIGDQERNVLAKLVCIEEVAVALKSRILKSPTGRVAEIFAQLGRAQGLDQWIVEIAEAAVQPAVRAKAYRIRY